MTFFFLGTHIKRQDRDNRSSLTKIKHGSFMQFPEVFFHIHIPSLLTFTLAGTPLKVASFSPFISLGISVSASLFGESNGSHTSPLAVSDCVDDIYACLSVRIFFQSSRSLRSKHFPLQDIFFFYCCRVQTQKFLLCACREIIEKHSRGVPRCKIEKTPECRKFLLDMQLNCC